MKLMVLKTPAEYTRRWARYKREYHGLEAIAEDYGTREVYYTLPLHYTTLHYTRYTILILYYTILYYTILYCDEVHGRTCRVGRIGNASSSPTCIMSVEGVSTMRCLCMVQEICYAPVEGMNALISAACWQNL